MAKEKILFECESCGALAHKWAGQCAKCGEWNVLVEKKSTPVTGNLGGTEIDFSEKPQEMPQQSRSSSEFPEVNRVLGGGFFSGSLVLLIGNPGIGKSTVSLQIAQKMAKKTEKPVLIFSGEESAFQVLHRAERLGEVSKNLKVAAAFRIEDVVATAERMNPALVVVDSVQTFVRGDLPNAPASLPQIRAVTESIMHFAKTSGVPTILIGQVNKDGDMAGPQTLAHLVDVVLQFEGDSGHDLRILRSLKNRFGATSEIGVFEMTESGLAEVKNPSAAFLEGRLKNAIGSAIFPAVEGNRPFLVEMQALTATSPFGLPKRSASGFSLSRLALLLAVLESRAQVKLSALDVFGNVVGGFKIDETAADLAMCLALVSSKNKIPMPSDLIAIGEIGLSGEIRAVSHLEKRLLESEKLGFRRAIVPKMKKIPKTSMEIIAAETLAEAIQNLR